MTVLNLKQNKPHLINWKKRAKNKKKRKKKKNIYVTVHSKQEHATGFQVPEKKSCFSGW